jgi:TolA-binding protein
MVVTLFYKSLTKRKRVPTVVSVHDEFSQRITTTNYNSQIQDAEEPRIQQIINRIREIERKIEIVKSQNISEEAKNITIRELEEEKRMLEEEIKKYLT